MQIAARLHMVQRQLLPNQVTDARLIAAMGEVPREAFVPENRRDIAYGDENLELAAGRYLMEPRVFARLLQAAEIAPADVVLDVGCASGYSTAVLARLAATVVGLEADKALAADAARTLSQLGIDNAVVVEGSLAGGLPKQGPFDVIVVEGAIERRPDDLLRQLAEGGRLLAVHIQQGVGRATLWRRSGELTARRDLFDAAVRKLADFDAPAAFVF
jgi:protein-L-isoaspartate(D-aspartate) O-methyltransferase